VLWVELLFGLQSLLRHSENGTVKYLFCKGPLLCCIYLSVYTQSMPFFGEISHRN
jgi:hypothetical protein